nr:hypothetical protein CFP56_55116 [Quercus suber]
MTTEDRRIKTMRVAININGVYSVEAEVAERKLTVIGQFDKDELVRSLERLGERIKQIRDKLVVVSVILDDEKLLHVAFDGLPSEYASFSSAIRIRSDVLSVEELNTLLNAEEGAIKKRFGFVDANTLAMAANFQSQGFGRRRGKNNNQRGHGGRGFNFNGGNGFNGGRGFNGSNSFTCGNVSQFGQSSQARPPGFSGQSSQNGGFQGQSS